MKKSIILMGIAAMAFASCAKDTIKETNNGRAIDFRVATHTRATETTTANLTTFYVTAINESGSNYFTNVAFTKVDSYFTSSPLYYWPGEETLQFYAYAPSATTLGATVTIDKEKQVIEGYAPAIKFADQKDLVTTTATGSKENEAEGVALKFNHQLSQLEVKARNANDAYTYKIKGVRFAQPVAQGSLNLATGEWALTTSNKAVYDVTYDNVVELNTYAQNLMETEGDNAMLLPQQLVAWDAENDKENANEGAYISVYAQITTAEGARVYPKAEGMEYAWLAVPVDTKWEAGYKYVYTLDFTEGAGYPDPIGGDGSEGEVLGGPIKLTMSVNPWTKKEVSPTKSPLVGTWEISSVKSVMTYADGSEPTEHQWEYEEFISRFDQVVHKITFASATTFYLNGIAEPFETTKYNGKDVFYYIAESDDYIYLYNNSPLTLHIEYTDEDAGEWEGKECTKEDVYIYYNKQ